MFIGVDIAKATHYACAVTTTGEHVLARPIPNDEAAICRLINDASTRGGVALVIDTTSSAAQLLMRRAAQKHTPLAYVTGLVMRRAADLYAGAAKNRPQRRCCASRLVLDATQTASTGADHQMRCSHTYASPDARDTDLATDATKIANRLRDALLTVSPALERAIGSRLTTNKGLRETLTRWGSPTELKKTRACPYTPCHSKTLTTHKNETHRQHMGSTQRANRHHHSRNRVGRHYP